MLRDTKSYANKQDLARDFQISGMLVDPRWIDEDNLPFEIICFYRDHVVFISAIDYREGLKKPLQVQRWAWPEISLSSDRCMLVDRHGQR